MTNILLLGDAGAGKSSWLRRLMSRGFTESYVTTIGLDTDVLTFDGRKIIIHDLGGHERFAYATRLYYPIAHGALIFYDKTRTTPRTNYWTHKIPDVPYILVGNKNDLAHRHTHGHSISCKNDEGVIGVLRDLLERVPEVPDEETTILDYIWYFLTRLWTG
jgi:small GTP-binding protein